MITFSEFAKLLYPHLGARRKQKNYEFIFNLVTQIIEDPVSKEDKQLDADDKYNPLAEFKPNTLNKYFSGHSKMSPNTAQRIITHIDKEKFTSLFENVSNDTLDHIAMQLKEKEIEIDDTVGETCANLFEKILHEIASKNLKSKPAKSPALTINEPLQNLSGNDQINIPKGCEINAPGECKISIPEECKICLYCKNWEGNLRNAKKSIAGVYGTCIIYDSKMKSTNKITCEDFKPNYSRISNYLLTRN